MKTKVLFEDYPGFTPDYTPSEMALLGIFGGNYFAREHYKEDYKYENTQGFVMDIISLSEDKSLHDLLESRYDKTKNHFKVQCGSSLEDWSDRGWLFTADKYGWYEWYIKFYYGRRNSYMDKKQIQRWSSFKSRHSGMLKAHCKPSEINKSLKTRQNLLHWAVDSTKV